MLEIVYTENIAVLFAKARGEKTGGMLCYTILCTGGTAAGI